MLISTGTRPFNMFIFSTIKCELIKQLYNKNLRRLPSQHGEICVMYIPNDNFHYSYSHSNVLIHIFRPYYALFHNFASKLPYFGPNVSAAKNIKPRRKSMTSDYSNNIKFPTGFAVASL